MFLGELSIKLFGDLLVLFGLLNVLINIVHNAELEFEFPDKKLQNSILPHLFGYLASPIDTDIAENPQKNKHIILVDVGAHGIVGRGLSRGRDLLGMHMGVDQLSDCERRVQFDEVNHAELDVETGGLLLEHEGRDVGVAVVVHFCDEPQRLLVKVVQLAVLLLQVAVVRVYQILQPRY